MADTMEPVVAKVFEQEEREDRPPSSHRDREDPHVVVEPKSNADGNRTGKHLGPEVSDAHEQARHGVAKLKLSGLAEPRHHHLKKDQQDEKRNRQLDQLC